MDILVRPATVSGGGGTSRRITCLSQRGLNPGAASVRDCGGNKWLLDVV